MQSKPLILYAISDFIKITTKACNAVSVCQRNLDRLIKSLWAYCQEPALNINSWITADKVDFAWGIPPKQ